MNSNITMTLLVALYLGITTYAVAALQGNRHSAAITIAARYLPR